MRTLPTAGAALAAALTSPSVWAQTEFLVDVGDAKLPSGQQGAQFWNDVNDQNWTTVIPLFDSAGNPSQVTLSFPQPVGRGELNGIVALAPGSPLEQLGWPDTALGDTVGWDTLFQIPEIRFVLDGLDPTATLDFTFVGAVTDAGASLATEVTVFGADEVATQGEISLNTSEVLRIPGLRPRPDGTLDLRIRNATSNTSFGRRYYLNAFSMVEHPAGTQPPVLGFSTNQLDASRPLSGGGVAGSLRLYTSDGAPVEATLHAVDLATGLAPSWLAVPSEAVAGASFGLVIDPGELPLGTYTAQLTAAEPGYTGPPMKVVLRVRDPARLNLLYYGNSYSNANGMVPTIVELLAEEAGLVVPNSVPRFSSGKSLAFHLNASQTLAISRSMPLGEEWDVVMLQGGTVEATSTAGNPTQYVSDGVQIMSQVTSHSPDVSAVVIQTWARGQGHPFYLQPGAIYPGGPLDMHRELESGNRELAEAIDDAFGTGTATIAAAGETVALRGFDPLYYNPDLSHPSPLLTAQDAGTVFSAIFGLPACSFTPDFSPAGPLATHLATIGLDEDDWLSVSAMADRAGPDALRPFPGSSEDLLLETGPVGKETACGKQAFPAGTKLGVRLSSPAGTYAGEPARIYVDRLGTSGGSTFVPPWHEVHYTQSAQLELSVTTLGSGADVELLLPLELVGYRLLVQCLSEGASPNTNHPMTFTDAHEVQVLPPPLSVPQVGNP